MSFDDRQLAEDHQMALELKELAMSKLAEAGPMSEKTFWNVCYVIVRERYEVRDILDVWL